jgi:DNA-binding response OmpR family regulator/signal transduction histidine kinase
MVNIKLKKILLKDEVLEFIHGFVKIMDIPLYIEDHQGISLIDLGGKEQPNRYQVEIEGNTIGWVMGDDRVLPIASLLNSFAAAEYEKKSLARETLEKYREINLLHNISEKISSCLDLEEISDLAIEEVQRLMTNGRTKEVPAISGALFLLNDNTGKLELLKGFGKANYPNMSIAPCGNIISDVMLKGEGEIVNDVLSDPRFIKGDKNVSSMICVPLKTKNRVIGGICVCSREPHHMGREPHHMGRDLATYSSEDKKRLNMFALYTASAVENAQLYNNLEQKVKERTRELEEMNKAKSRFFANISHEFRTPLTLIMGPLEQILSDNPEKTMEAKARLMLRNSRRLLNLINQLLELARLDSGKMKLQASEQNIVPFLKNMVMCFKTLATLNKVDLIFYEEEKEITIYFDPEKLEKIITNLLANAFKYTPAQGSITVTVGKAEGTDAFPSGCVEISVKDTGTGIPGNLLPHIFDRFFQAEGRHEHKHKGSGIGLALTKELVELHHGEIKVQSSCREDHSRGTKFFLRLPQGKEHLQPEEIAAIHEPGKAHQLPGLEEPCKPSPAHIYIDTTEEETEVEETPESSEKPTVSAPERKKVEKPIVLVVEDNNIERLYIKVTLENYFNVVEAADGKQGILRAKEIIPDLIVSDIIMPEIDGYELCRTLKKDVLTSHIPIILLTVKGSEESVLQGYETGADDYLTKPFSKSLLVVRARNLIDLHRQLQLERTNLMRLQPKEIPVSPMDDEFYKKLQDTVETHLSDPDFNVEALGRVLQMSQATLWRKINGLTGITPIVFIRTYRLKRAAQLLSSGAVSVSQVADKVGFSDRSYFSKCFKEQFNRLPSEFLPPGGAGSPSLSGTAPAEAAPVPGAPTPGKEVILVVEDNDDARHYIRESLELDFRVVEAADGSEGITRAMEIIPDLVVSDIMMPGTDGIELCRLLKKDIRTSHIPIVLLTAKASEENIIKGLEVGTDDYITKPFNTNILRARIKNLIRLRSHLHKKRNREMTLLPAKISESEIDHQFMKELNTVIRQNLSDSDFNVEQLAKKLYMSSATVYRKIQALSGEIPSEYIRSFRLRRAAQLLKQNFGSVTEVAFEVGFKSRTYFTRCFKENFHQLPSVYMSVSGGHHAAH